MQNIKEELEKLRTNYCSIVAMLDELLLETLSKEELEFAQNISNCKIEQDIDSNIIDKIAVVSTQSQQILINLLKKKSGS